MGTKLLFSTSHHPQTDGQTEVTNRTLGTILRTLINKNLKDWDLQLAQAEFAYNRSPSATTKHTPFEVVYGLNPITPIDLTILPIDVALSTDAETKAKEMKKIHESIRRQIEKSNEAYKKRANKHRKQAMFNEGDLVWIHLRKDRFPTKRKSKLAPRADGPFKVISRVGDNAYKIELPGEYGGVSATFNIGDLSPFREDENLQDLRSNPSQTGEDDVIGLNSTHKAGQVIAEKYNEVGQIAKGNIDIGQVGQVITEKHNEVGQVISEKNKEIGQVSAEELTSPINRSTSIMYSRALVSSANTSSSVRPSRPLASNQTEKQSFLSESLACNISLPSHVLGVTVLRIT